MCTFSVVWVVHMSSDRNASRVGPTSALAPSPKSKRQRAKTKIKKIKTADLSFDELWSQTSAYLNKSRNCCSTVIVAVQLSSVLFFQCALASVFARNQQQQAGK